MPKSPDIFINGFQKGIGLSPYVGFGRMQNMEIFQIPGVAKMKYRQTLKYSVGGLPIAIVHDNVILQNNEWVLTYNNLLYKNGVQVFTGTYNGSGTAFDMKVIASNFLMITRADGTTGYIDIINLQSVGGSLFADWGRSGSVTGAAALTNLYNLAIQVLTGNQYIYIANGQNVATITSFTNTGALSAPTATLATAAIPLQVGDFARTLSVNDRNLIIGTQGGSSFADLTVTQANVYFYDLGSLTLGFPNPIEENGVNQIFTYNKQTYIHAGLYGNIYVTNGSSVQFYKTVVAVNRPFGTTMKPWPNGINYVNNRLLVGTGNVGATLGSTDYHGLYEIQDKTRALNFQTISTLNVGQSNNLAVGAVLPVGGDTILLGWQDGSSYGVDTTDQTTYDSFSSFVECPVEIVANPQDNASYDDIIVYLAQPLVSGQQIQLQWKDGFSSSWTTITDYRNGNAYLSVADNPTSPVAGTALYTKSLINNAQTVQVRYALKQSGNNPGNNILVLGVKILKHTNG